MSNKIAEVNEKEVGQDECQHYWIIESANGPTSRGVCRICGAEREFSNSFPDFAALARGSRPHELPKLPQVEVDGEQS